MKDQHTRVRRYTCHEHVLVCTTRNILTFPFALARRPWYVAVADVLQFFFFRTQPIFSTFSQRVLEGYVTLITQKKICS